MANMRSFRWLCPAVAICFLLAYPVFHHGTIATLLTEPIIVGDGLWDGLPNASFYQHYSFWNPFINAGAPNLVIPNHQPLYVPALFWLRISDSVAAFNILLLIHASLMGVFTYLFLRTLSCNIVASTLGGVVTSCGGFMSCHFDHHYMVECGAWMPLALFAVERFRRRKRFAWLFVLAGCTALMWLAGHPQIGLYSILLVTAYIASKYFDEGPISGRIATVAWLYAALALGCVLALPQISPILESFTYIQRSSLTYEAFSQSSLPPGGLLLYLFPSLFGLLGSTLYGNEYVGPWYAAEMAPYVSSVVLCLALVGVRFAKRLGLTFWAIVAVFSIVAAMGDHTPLGALLFKTPGVNLFRALARWLWIASFALAVMAARTLSVILDSPDRRRELAGTALKISAFLACLGITAVALLRQFVLYADPKKAGDSFWLWMGNSGVTGSTSLAALSRYLTLDYPGVAIPFAAMLLSLAAFAICMGTLRRGVRAAVVFCVCVADLYSFGHYFTNWPQTEDLRARGAPLEAWLRKEEGIGGTFRLWPMDDYSVEEMGPKTNMLFGRRVINNYGPILFKDYTDLTGFLTSGYTGQKSFLVENNVLLSLLGVKYLVTSDRSRVESMLGQSCDAPPRSGDEEACLADTLYPKGEWMLNNAREQGGAVLLAAAGNVFSSAVKGLPIQPSKNYHVTFTARRPGGTGSTRDGLNVQFFNFEKGYGRPELERKVSSLAGDWRPYSVTINTGKNAPSDAEVRLYTYDTAAIEVKDIKMCHLVATVTSTIACSGANTGKGNGHLYRELTTLPSGATVFRNEQWLPTARFVRHVRSVKDIPEARQIFVEPHFNPEDEALVSGNTSAKSYAAGSVQSFDDGKGDHLRLSTTTEGRAFLVLSLFSYPGWRARVDGRPAALVKTYGVLTGLEIPDAGKHEITLDFVPDSFWLGVQWAAIGFAAFTVLVAGAQWPKWRRGRREPASHGLVQ